MPPTEPCRTNQTLSAPENRRPKLSIHSLGTPGTIKYCIFEIMHFATAYRHPCWTVPPLLRQSTHDVQARITLILLSHCCIPVQHMCHLPSRPVWRRPRTVIKRYSSVSHSPLTRANQYNVLIAVLISCQQRLGWWLSCSNQVPIVTRAAIVHVSPRAGRVEHRPSIQRRRRTIRWHCAGRRPVR